MNKPDSARVHARISSRVAVVSEVSLVGFPRGEAVPSAGFGQDVVEVWDGCQPA